MIKTLWVKLPVTPVRTDPEIGPIISPSENQDAKIPEARFSTSLPLSE